jgi:hypothetical protein
MLHTSNVLFTPATRYSPRSPAAFTFKINPSLNPTQLPFRFIHLAPAPAPTPASPAPLSFRAKTLRVFPYLWYQLVLDTLTHRDDIPTNTKMFTPQKTIRIRMRSDLDKFLHELTHTWDANAASSVKYFVFLEFANTSTGYPEAVEELVKSLKVILDKCNSLRVLAFHKDCCPTPTSTELTVSAMKKVADELLGHHPILSRLAQYDGSILHEDPTDHTTTWALISKRDDKLGHWMLTPKAVRFPRTENPLF